LDAFGFKYEFVSATDEYKAGRFNDTLLKVVDKYEDLMKLMLANLGEERQETYSPLMPLCPRTGKILAEGVKGVNKAKGTVIYVNEFGEEIEQTVLDGNCKLQWKIDFGARWRSLGVDYEIFGKDHAPNEKIYRRVCEILGGKPPVNFCYELFLGEDGAKISKSKGNGIGVEEWLKYAPIESLSLFMFQKPKTAKRLYFDTIPKCVDEYIKYVESYQGQTPEQKLENPAYYIHFGEVCEFNFGGLNYSLLLNLVSACNPENDGILWGFIEKYNPNLARGKYAFLDKIVASAINYYNDFVKPNKQFRTPNEAEKASFDKIYAQLPALEFGTPEEIQNLFYAVGMESGMELKDWFKANYQVLLGQEQGPRLGSFVSLYGVANFLKLMQDKIYA
jgi:lysyl-tRNA synthetase class 1